MAVKQLSISDIISLVYDNRASVVSSLFVIDLGNGNIKTCRMNEQGNLVFGSVPHALLHLSKEKAQAILNSQDGAKAEVYLVNGEYYALGDYAYQHMTGDPVEGAHRYTQNYAGVIAACVAYNQFIRQHQKDGAINVRLFVSHPPTDSIYAKDLSKAIAGKWRVKRGDIEEPMTVNFVNVETFSEPFGTGAAMVYTPYGGSVENDIAHIMRHGAVDVYDWGEFTLSRIPFNKGVPDYANSRSLTGIGGRAFKADVWSAIRADNSEALKGIYSYRPDLMYHALKTGVYMVSGKALKVDEIIQSAQLRFLREAENFYKQGGSAQQDLIIATGGTTRWMFDGMAERFNHQGFTQADANDENLIYVNSVGAHNFAVRKAVASHLKG